MGYNRVPILLANITATYSDDDENGVGTEEDGGIDLVVPVVDIGIVRFMTLVIFLIDFGWFNNTYVCVYIRCLCLSCESIYCHWTLDIARAL